MPIDDSWEQRRRQLHDRRAARKADAAADLQDMIVANWPTAEEKRTGDDRRAKDRRAKDRRAQDRRAGHDRRVAQAEPGQGWDGVERRLGPRRDESQDRRLGPRRTDAPPDETAMNEAPATPVVTPGDTPVAAGTAPAPTPDLSGPDMSMAADTGPAVAMPQFVQQPEPAAEPVMEEPVLQEEVPVPVEAPAEPEVPWEERIDPITGRAFPPYRE